MSLTDWLLIFTGIFINAIFIFLIWTLWREDYKESAEGKDKR